MVWRMLMLVLQCQILFEVNPLGLPHCMFVVEMLGAVVAEHMSELRKKMYACANFILVSFTVG